MGLGSKLSGSWGHCQTPETALSVLPPQGCGGDELEGADEKHFPQGEAVYQV